MLLDIDKKMVLDRLPIAEGASFDSYAEEHNRTCLATTRVELLQQISEWADNPGAGTIFWLNGMAGTGKSTISRTVAQSFATTGHLAASFFFKRGEGDRGSLAKLFTTIAADLVVKEPFTAPCIKATLDADPSTITKNVREQFHKLFVQPLSQYSKDDPAVIIVDGLDECDRDDDVKLIIYLFAQASSELSKWIKIFLTSRPELPLRLGFHAIDGKHQDVALHEMPQPVVERDIGAFLSHELARIREEYNASVAEKRRLPLDWPTQSDFQYLLKMAVPLFISAATMCRFIADRKYGNPEKQLKKVLSNQTKSHESVLAETYILVLDQQIAGLSKSEEIEAVSEFREIVGPIIMLATPLSTSSLARMLSISADVIDDRLDLLHSVLAVPQSADAPVRLLHVSFRDFLADSGRRETNPFWVDEKRTHANLTASCLRVLRILKKDLCDIRASGTARSAISAEKIHSCLPPEVQYACLYWVYHLKMANILIADGSEAHEFLECHFLHWIEALALIGRAAESLPLIKTLQSQLQVRRLRDC